MKRVFRKKNLKFLTLFTLGCFLITGCSASKDKVEDTNQQQDELSAVSTVYRVTPSNRTTSQWENAYGVISHDGKMIIPIDNHEVNFIYDDLTNQQLWIQTSTRFVDDPALSAEDLWKDDNWNKVHETYKIYDLEGNLVKDLGENGIMTVYGDLVLHYNRQLVDKNSGKLYYDDVNTLHRSGDYYVMNTKDYSQVRILDNNLNVVYETDGGFIAVGDQYYISAEIKDEIGKRIRGLQRLDGTEIVPYGYEYFSSGVVQDAPYVIANRDNIESVLSLEDGHVIYQESGENAEYDYIQYFLKDCMVIQKREVVATAEQGGWPIYAYYSQLYNYDGEPIGEKYRSMYPCTEAYRIALAHDGKAEMLFNATTQNGVEVIINQAGEVLYQIPENGWLTVINDKRVIINDYDTNVAALCDESGNPLTEKAYEYMHTFYMESTSGEYICTNLINANYMLAGKVVYDLLDLDGNVVIERAKSIQTLSEDRFWVEKGFYQGMMDREGNWLYKQSVFDSAADE